MRQLFAASFRGEGIASVLRLDATPNLSFDRKFVAVQLGHGFGVDLDICEISNLGQRIDSLNLPEQSLASAAVN